MLRQAKVPRSGENVTAFQDLVLATPGLERMVSGVLVDAATLHSVTMRRSVPPLLAERRVPIGVRMGDETVHGLDVAGSTNGLAGDVDRHAVAGASFARWRLVVGEGVAASGLRPTAALVARWAATCLLGGLAPFVDCVVLVRPHHRLEDAEQVHSTAVGTVLDALSAARVDAGSTLLGSSLVVPGRRSSAVATPEDIARATIASLRAAGADGIGGVAFTSTGRSGRLAAHLAATQWLSPDWPVGYCVGRSMLTGIAQVWRGRAGNVTEAQAELHNRLNCAQAGLRAGLDEGDRRAVRAIG